MLTFLKIWLWIECFLCGCVFGLSAYLFYIGNAIIALCATAWLIIAAFDVKQNIDAVKEMEYMKNFK